MVEGGRLPGRRAVTRFAVGCIINSGMIRVLGVFVVSFMTPKAVARCALVHVVDVTLCAIGVLVFSGQRPKLVVVQGSRFPTRLRVTLAALFGIVGCDVVGVLRLFVVRLVTGVTNLGHFLGRVLFVALRAKQRGVFAFERRALVRNRRRPLGFGVALAAVDIQCLVGGEFCAPIKVTVGAGHPLMMRLLRQPTTHGSHRHKDKNNKQQAAPPEQLLQSLVGVKGNLLFRLGGVHHVSFLVDDN